MPAKKIIWDYALNKQGRWVREDGKTPHFGTTQDAFTTKLFNEMTKRSAFGTKRFNGETKRFNKMTTHDAFEATRFNFGTKRDAFGTKRFNETTTRDAFKTKRFTFGAKRVDETTEHDVFGIKSVDKMPFSGSNVPACSENGHGRGFLTRVSRTTRNIFNHELTRIQSRGATKESSPRREPWVNWRN